MEMHFAMQLGEPFDRVLYCRRCGEEVLTMHFHGRGAPAAKRMDDFMAGPGRVCGPHYVGFVEELEGGQN
jgi:hypothetical protein